MAPDFIGPPPPPKAPSVEVDVSGLKHMALRNALYHSARRGCLDGVNRFFNLLTILGGTSAAATLTSGDRDSAFYLGAGIALIGALQLVFDYGGRARTHDYLQRRYYELLAEIERCLNPTSVNCAQWMAQVANLSAEEPPTLRALDAIAYNQASSSLLGAGQGQLSINGWQSLTRQMFAHNTADFQPK